MQVKDNKTLIVSIKGFKDAQGFDTKLAAGVIPSWAVDNDAVASISASADGLSAVVTAKGVGPFNVQCSIAAAGDEPAMQGSYPSEFVAGVEA